jgi:hypothetical protein
MEPHRVVQRRVISWRCQCRMVAGVTSSPRRRRTGSGRVRAAIRAVGPGHSRARRAPLEHRELMAQDQDLDVLGGVGSGVQHDPAEELGEHLVDQSQRHQRSMPGTCRGRMGRSRAVCTVSGTHTREPSVRPRTASGLSHLGGSSRRILRPSRRTPRTAPSPRAAREARRLDTTSDDRRFSGYLSRRRIAATPDAVPGAESSPRNRTLATSSTARPSAVDNPLDHIGERPGEVDHKLFEPRGPRSAAIPATISHTAASPPSSCTSDSWPMTPPQTGQ